MPEETSLRDSIDASEFQESLEYLFTAYGIDIFLIRRHHSDKTNTKLLTYRQV